MRSLKSMRRALHLAALALVSVAAQDVSANAPQKYPAEGQPIQIPVFDGDLIRQSVQMQPAMQQIAAPLAQAVSTGSGVVVALLDGGFDLRHEALAGRLLPAFDVLNGDCDAQDLGDGIVDNCVGHGTFVSSLILAVAPNAMIIPIRVLDDEGWGTANSVAAGVQYAVAHGAKIINMSLVVPDSNNVLRDALRSATSAGILVVGAAGNDAKAWQDDPNLASLVLAVGAVDGSNCLLPWSATGSLVNIYAPGDTIIGAIGATINGQPIPLNSYGFWSGTSFSTPFVSGGAALLFSAHPGMTSQQVVSRLTATVDISLNVQPWNRGRIDLGRALTQ